MKALVKWFDGVDIRIPFVSIKFKKPNNTTDSTLTDATGLNKTNNWERDDKKASLFCWSFVRNNHTLSISINKIPCITNCTPLKIVAIDLFLIYFHYKPTNIHVLSHTLHTRRVCCLT
ncbi:hypothetical protein [Bacillus cereus]|uniref:hypothetical protein n=1 Tax=Bacillus cereus TaxID=1396 RepID=UPI000BF7FE9A|nr:hypothetical protein [Bacillus cereus]PFW06594.1 hypothetical protein COL12_18420 [Bacillus cereus]